MKRLSWPCSPVFDALFVKEVKRGIFPAGTSGRKGSDRPFLSGGEADRRGRFGGIKGANANSLRGQGSRGKACPPGRVRLCRRYIALAAACDNLFYSLQVENLSFL